MSAQCRESSGEQCQLDEGHNGPHMTVSKSWDAAHNRYRSAVISFKDKFAPRRRVRWVIDL